MHYVCAELISESVNSLIIWTYFVYSENVLIPKINSDLPEARAQYSFKTWLLPSLSEEFPQDHKCRLPRRCNSVGYYCDRDQLEVIPEVVTSSGGPIHSSENRLLFNAGKWVIDSGASVRPQITRTSELFMECGCAELISECQLHKGMKIFCLFRKCI